MQFTDICLITEDVLKLRAFYEAVFDQTAEGDETHSTLALDGFSLTFDCAASLKDNPAFWYVSATSSSNTILGFLVDNVDAEYKRLLSLGIAMLGQPTTHPWGARSFQCKDPDGNILNFRSWAKN